MDSVILVDKEDQVIGEMEKLEAHQKGVLHRAFSVFVFNDNKELLIHRRAADKYHSANLWTNTCCSHQKPGETNIEASKRRLVEEMGFSCDVIDVCSFIYQIDFENGLAEHELDHILVGIFNDSPNPNPAEASEWKYLSIEKIQQEIKDTPEQFTFWFKHIFDNHLPQLIEKLQ